MEGSVNGDIHSNKLFVDLVDPENAKTQCEKIGDVDVQNNEVLVDLLETNGSKDSVNSVREGGLGFQSDDVMIEREDAALLYNVNDVPPLGIIVSIAMQNILLGLGGALSTAYVISDVICASPDHPIRAQLFCTTLFMSGLCTILQSSLGVRLPIYQGVCSTFLVPLMAMRSEDKWKCDNTFGSGIALNTTSQNHTVGDQQGSDEEMFYKLREMMGCLMLASLVEVLVGLTGLVGFMMLFIGPLTIAVVISLIGLSLYKIPLAYMRTHWGMSAVCIVATVVFMLYMERFGVPCPRRCASRKSRERSEHKVAVFQMFPILLAILMTWLVCCILTVSGALTDDPSQLSYRARTDARQGLLYRTPWLYFPYPGQFGTPLFNLTIFVGFVSAVISSVLESIGDYYAAAHISRAPPPPRHAVNRGILLEGLGSVISGALGAGHATTSATANVALVGISKTASRSCLVAAGILCILFSVVGKFGALLSTMPDPAIGGAMFVTFGVLGSIGIFTLRSVDLTSSRNLAIFGISLYTGLLVPEWADRYPEAIATGSLTADGILKGVLGTPMFLGGVVAVLLDNTVKGTLKERGFISRDHKAEEESYLAVSESETYDIPFVSKLIEKFPWIQKLPFVQNMQ